MKLVTNIQHLSGDCLKVSQSQRSRL